jgi:hypothetical protein
MDGWHWTGSDDALPIRQVLPPGLLRLGFTTGLGGLGFS